jgi:hypothetical protein
MRRFPIPLPRKSIGSLFSCVFSCQDVYIVDKGGLTRQVSSDNGLIQPFPHNDRLKSTFDLVSIGPAFKRFLTESMSRDPSVSSAYRKFDSTSFPTSFPIFWFRAGQTNVLKEKPSSHTGIPTTASPNGGPVLKPLESPRQGKMLTARRAPKAAVIAGWSRFKFFRTAQLTAG